jgi:hypothetical protein
VCVCVYACAAITYLAMNDFVDDEEFSDDEMTQYNPSAAAGAGGVTGGIHQRIEELESMWLCSESRDAMTVLRQKYGWSEVGYDPQHALNVFEDALQNVSVLSGGLERLRTPDGNDGVEFTELRPRVVSVMRAIQESYHTLVALSGWHGHQNAPVMTTDDMIVRFSTNPTDKDSDIQIVYKFILEWCLKYQLRHKGDVVYQEILVEGRKTRAWIPAVHLFGMSEPPRLRDLISLLCTRQRNEAVYNKQLNVPAQKLIEKLEMCREVEFPVLKTTRSWISWKDGIYSVYHDMFLYYTDTRISFPEDMAVCAYHPMNFGPAWLGEEGHALHMNSGSRSTPTGIPVHPYDLPTPYFDSIMEIQKLCGRTKFWLMAMLGRSLFWSNFLDSWQVVLYIKGIAGTGKSTLVQLVAGLYDQTDVFVIPNCTEGTFGLQGLTPMKLLWIAPEVKEDFNMDQAQFQSLVSNERLALPRKHTSQFEGRILSHGIMAGNLTPQRWNDNASSIQRRIFMVNFAHQVPGDKKNSDLMGTLKTVELAKIVRKLVFCYHRAVVLVGSGDLWGSGLLSPHILLQNKGLGENSNPLRRYLAQGEGPMGVTFKLRTADEGAKFYWCPVEVFKVQYNEWKKQFENDKRICTFNEDMYGAIFADYGLTVEHADFVWRGDSGNSETKNKEIVVGCVPCNQFDSMVTIDGQDNPRIRQKSNLSDPLLLTQESYNAMRA